MYHQTSEIIRNLVGNEIVHHSDIHALFVNTRSTTDQLKRELWRIADSMYKSMRFLQLV